MLRWNVLLGMLLNVVCGATEDAGDLRVIRLGSKPTAFFLYFSKCFRSFRHDAQRLERPDAGNY
jgi:hypothetical protein